MAEQPDQVGRSLQRLAAVVRAHVDLDGVVALARSAPARSAGAVPLPAPGAPIRVAVAAGPAFTFTYRDTLDALEAAGAEIIPFDPLPASRLPSSIDGLVVGGGFPEVHGAALAANGRCSATCGARCGPACRPGPSAAACCSWPSRLDGRPMAGVVAGQAVMTDRLTLGYRHAVTTTESPIGPAGTRIRGHEFHYSTLAPAGQALQLSSQWGRADRRLGHARPCSPPTSTTTPAATRPRLAPSPGTCALRRTLRGA